MSVPLLSTLAVSQTIEPFCVFFELTCTVSEAERVLIDQTSGGAPVLDQRGILRGVLTQRDI